MKICKQLKNSLIPGIVFLTLITTGCREPETFSGVVAVTGQVVDDVSGSPVPGTKIFLTPRFTKYFSGTYSFHDDQPVMALTDSLGYFSIQVEVVDVAQVMLSTQLIYESTLKRMISIKIDAEGIFEPQLTRC
ncbi:MAG: hypothetical protein JJU02_09580 [Cryomorphaceae bacterium]|nr:hypothetical protein [Cryomorphaceae bacterium]